VTTPVSVSDADSLTVVEGAGSIHAGEPAPDNPSTGQPDMVWPYTPPPLIGVPADGD
jgi:hypothetical protein